MIIRLHHAHITVPVGAEDQARAFYCLALGLPEIEKPASLTSRGGFWLQVGDQSVHVGTETGADRMATKAHLAYLVDDLAVWLDKLQAIGIATSGGIPIPGYDRFEFRDPFGNRVEFISAL